MNRAIRWYDHITINIYWLGLNIASGSITPVILPYLVALFVAPEVKNTSLATVRVVGLAMAMLVQPIAGMLSDRSTLRWGRRRPFIFVGALLNVLFLAVVGSSPLFRGSSLDQVVEPALGINTAYGVLLLGIVLLQISSNIAHGALQGIIPDLVPENQRGRSSGVKAVFELLPSLLIVFLGPLVDKGLIWVAIGIIMLGFLITMLITVLCVKEEPLAEKPTGKVGGPLLRLFGLTAIFVVVSQVAVRLVRLSAALVTDAGVGIGLQVTLVGLAGLIGMAGSIFVGVYFGAWVGVGSESRQQKAFIWWVVNRLLFLAAVGSVQGFAQYFLSDVLKFEKAATMTTILLAVVALFLMPSAIGGGYWADRIGRKRLVAYSGLVAAGGTFLLLFATSFPLVLLCGCIIGLATGTFFATNWALGTDLVPRQEAGRYLGVSNLAGAGAGIVGAGIGGPMADFFNGLRPGLGYLVIFALYACLFLISVVVLRLVPEPERPRPVT